MPALTLQNFSVSSMGERLITSVSLTFSGNAFCICGGKNAGKTPLCLALAGFGETEGKVMLNAKDITALSPEQRNVGVLFGKPKIFSGSVEKNIGYGLALRKEAGIKERVRAAACRLGIEHLLKEKAKKCKGIAAQKIALARLLARKPVAIFADFPVRGESEEELDFLSQAIAACKELGILFLCFTESAVQAKLFERMGVLEGGVLTFFGTGPELIAAPPTLTAATYAGEELNVLYGERAGGMLKVGDAAICKAEGEGPALAAAFEDFAAITPSGHPCRVDYAEEISAGTYRYFLDFSLPDEEKEGKKTRFTLLSAVKPQEGQHSVCITVNPEKVFVFAKNS